MTRNGTNSWMTRPRPAVHKKRAQALCLTVVYALISALQFLFLPHNLSCWVGGHKISSCAGRSVLHGTAPALVFVAGGNNSGHTHTQLQWLFMNDLHKALKRAYQCPKRRDLAGRGSQGAHGLPVANPYVSRRNEFHWLDVSDSMN